MPIAALREICKSYGTTTALRGATLELEPGEIHALLGENGAGKTTLIRVLYGLVRPDAGRVEVAGRELEIRGPRHALSLGIGCVHQHFMLVPALTVAENLILGEPGPALLGQRRMRAQARALLREYGLDLDPDLPAEGLGVAQKQRLEIVRALARGVRLLILDEPTAVLAPSEVEALLRLLAQLRSEGRTLVFISHRLEEISRVCDRVTVLRGGASVATRPVAEIGRAELGRLMVGEDLPGAGAPVGGERGGPALRLRGLRAGGLHGVDLEVCAGEIYAVAGIDGNGQAPLEEVLAGVRPVEGGVLEVVAPPLSLISGDRHGTGLVLDLSVEENLVLAEAGRGTRLRRREIRAGVRDAIRHLDIRAQPGSTVRTLSGGNQQKLCVARALRDRPRILVAVNPTRGLDVRAAAAVRRELRIQVERGVGVLLISTDLDEVIELGDRIGVLFRGRLIPLKGGRGSRAQIGEMMLGAGAP